MADGDPEHERGTVDEGCPIPAAHRRLHDVHALWHEAADVYFDPDGFRRRLRLLIQEARNVTFLLQADKSAIPGFEEWYESWRRSMRADAIMSWLRDARTEVTKRGDLETLSKARATVLRSWTERAMSEGPVPPMQPMEAIVEWIAATLPEDLLESGLLVVERRWVVDDLPDHEVLDALAHCYGVLSKMLGEAHERCGSVYMSARETAAGLEPLAGNLDGRLPCMAMTDVWRRTCIKLKTGESLAFAQTLRVTQPDDERRARERYAEVLHDVTPGKPISGPHDLAEIGASLFEAGKRVLRHDGHHTSLIWIFTPDGRAHLNHVMPEDRDELIWLMENLAQQVELSGAWGVASVHESWIAPFDPEHPERGAVDSPDRREVFCVSVAVEDGRVRTHIAAFKHVEDRIEFEDEWIEEGPTTQLDMLPFLEVWRRRRERDGR